MTNKIEPTSKKHLFFEIIFYVFIFFALYLQTLRFEFVWDDLQLILNNPYFHQTFQWSDVFHQSFWKFSGINDVLPYYRPVVTLVFWSEVQCFGFDPMYFHAVNLCLHLGSLILIWSLCRAFNFPNWGRRMACLLFIIHPVMIPCVSFVSCQGDLLVQVFGLLAIRLWIEKDWTKGLALIAIFFGMLSKESAVTFPLILVAFTMMVEKKSWMKLSSWYPCVLWIFYFPFRWMAMGIVFTHSSNSFVFSNQGAYRTLSYLSRFLFPIPNSQYGDLRQVSVWICLGALFALAVLMIFMVRKLKPNPCMLFFMSWLFLSLFLVSGWIIPNVRFSDQLLYIPMAPLSLMFGSIPWHLNRTRVLALFVLPAFAMISFYIIRPWRNQYEFWKNEFRFHPQDPMTLISYGSIYNDHFQTNKGCSYFLRARDVIVKNYDAEVDRYSLYNLGNCYLHTAPATAESYYRKASAIPGYSSLIQNNLLVSLLEQKKLDEALVVARDMVSKNPDVSTAWKNLGVVYMRLDEVLLASQALAQASHLAPNDLQIGRLILELKKNDKKHELTQDREVHEQK